MSYLDTQQEIWYSIGQATLTVSNGDTADINTYAAAYGAAATGVQVASNMPGVVNIHEGVAASQFNSTYKDLYGKKLPQHASGARFRFMLMDTTSSASGADGDVTVWGFDANGAALDLFVLDLVAGTAAVLDHPTTGGTFTGTDFWAYADSYTLSNNHSHADVLGTTGANGVIEVRIDLVGMSYLFADWKLDGSSSGSKRSEDAICLAKWY